MRVMAEFRPLPAQINLYLYFMLQAILFFAPMLQVYEAVARG
jgi:hypothetical protein